MCIKQNHCMNQQGSITLVSESLKGCIEVYGASQ